MVSTWICNGPVGAMRQVEENLFELQGRGKKDAKQVAAAAVLEMLLANVSESDFLQPGKAKQAKHQPQVSSCALLLELSSQPPRPCSGQPASKALFPCTWLHI